MIHLGPPRITLRHRAPESRDFARGLLPRVPPHFERNTFKVRCEQVVFFSLGKVPTFGDFSQDFIRCKARRDFIRFRFQVEISFGLDEKNIKKITKYWHLTLGKNTTFSQRTLMGFLSKWGGPAAPTLHLYPSILGLGDAR